MSPVVPDSFLIVPLPILLNKIIFISLDYYEIQVPFAGHPTLGTAYILTALLFPL